jgi:molybdate transport system substrate-binding protein
MAELAKASQARPIGCTQATEILYTPGVTLVGALPGELALATVYAVAAVASAPALARRFAASLAGDSSTALRRRAGFDPAS